MEAAPGLQLLGFFGAGLLAGAVNTVAGGGSFVSLAAMIAFGMPAQVANATNRLGVLAQSATASARFRSEGVSGGDDLLPQLAVSTIGGAIGVSLSLSMEPRDFERVLGFAMILMLVVSLLRPSRWVQPAPPSPWRWPALLATSIYGGFIQAGVGVLLLPCLVRLGGVDAVSANARKVLLVAAFSVPSVAMYAWVGLIEWRVGALLAVSSSVGAWLGVWLTVGYGPRLVWAVLVLVVAISAGRLIF